MASIARERWWESRAFMCAIALLSALPLLWPEVPPLVDVPGHIGRYRVELDLGSSPDLQRYFEFNWALIGNLGVDGLIIPLALLVGLEPAVKIIVLLIPPLTVLGIFTIAREVHGKVPPTALFAVPFAYGYPFQFGFINFALATALALLAFALWLRLERKGQERLRAVVFVLISSAIWVVHAFGWGVLGLLVFSSELVRARDSGANWRGALGRALIAVAPLCLPLLFMLIWRSGPVAGAYEGYFNPKIKLYALIAALRDRWFLWDVMAVAAAIVVLCAAALEKNLGFSRRLLVPACILLIVFLALPYTVMGSAYADMRLAPLMLMIGLVGIRFAPAADTRALQGVAIVGLLFVLARIGGTTLSYAIADREAKERLGALDHVARGSAVLTLSGHDCSGEWAMPRHSHIGSFVIARRFGYANDQWQLPGAQLLRVTYRPAADFASDPSSMVYPSECQAKYNRRPAGRATLWPTAEDVVRRFPRDAFDYVWVVRAPEFPLSARPGLTPIWRGRDSILLRVDKRRLRER